MIYCVVPPELADELYDSLASYYRDEPNVEVIVDRREGPDGRQLGEGTHVGRRELRDRRRRIPGTFGPIDLPE